MKINQAKWDERTLETQKYIARWMYTHAIPFNSIDNDEFKQMCEAIGQFGPGLAPPTQYALREPLLKADYQDESIFESAKVTTRFMECVETFYHGDDIMQDQVVNYDFPLFQKRVGNFGKKLARTCQKFEYNPVAWWRMYGGETPDLQKLAIRILSLTSSASGCERNWSCYEAIHTKRRNRLTIDRLDDLVMIQFNSRLLSKRRRIKERKNIDVLLSSDASEAHGFFYEGGDDHALMVFRDGEET